MSNADVYIAALKKYSRPNERDSVANRIIDLEVKVDELIRVVVAQQELIEELQK